MEIKGPYESNQEAAEKRLINCLSFKEATAEQKQRVGPPKFEREQFFHARVPCLLDPVVCLGDAGTQTGRVNDCARVEAQFCLHACSCKGNERLSELSTVDAVDVLMVMLMSMLIPLRYYLAFR